MINISTQTRYLFYPHKFSFYASKKCHIDFHVAGPIDEFFGEEGGGRDVTEQRFRDTYALYQDALISSAYFVFILPCR